MKTPKASTPAVKSKLNTPRSGFIKKGSDSVKKMKFNVMNNEISKSNNSTPKLDKSAISENIMGKFGSGKKGKSPFNVSGIQFDGKKSPQKKKTLAESEAVTNMKTETPKTEQYLNKNSKPKIKSGAEKSTPTGNKQISSPKLSPSPKQKTSPNQKAGNQAKKRKASPNPKNNIGKNKKSENTEILVDKNILTDAVNALMRYIDENPKERSEMLDPNVPLLLQIDYIKQPVALRSRLLVPHSLVYENSDICLFIADKGKKIEEQDDLADEMKERLKKCGVDYITEILPWKKALFEHTQYEQKKKLMNRFDFFLIEDRLSKIRAGLTDKFVPKKWPIAVRLEPESKLKENIETALRKIPVSFRGNGLTKSLQFGHYKMDKQHLVENLQAITKALCDRALFFGGRDNIRSLHIKTKKSIAFPLFVNKKSSNLVKKQPKQEEEEDEGVEGELSTLPNRIVKVFKDGTVKTKKIKEDQATTSKKPNKKQVSVKKEESDDDEEEMMESDIDEEDDSDDDEEMSEDEDVDDEEVATDEDEDDDDDDDDDDDEEEEDDEGVSSEEEAQLRAKLNSLNKKGKPNKKDKKRKQESESDEEDVEEAERSFLEQLRKQQDDIEAQAKKALKSKTMEKMMEPLKKKMKTNKPASNNFPSKKETGAKGPNFSPKNQQKSNDNLKKNDGNATLSKSARRRQNKKKHNKNANNSPNVSPKNQNKKNQKPTPGGKKFKAKG
ncbi:hypothetical protein O3M35_006283 [Rhynocoris fuscipes]|uniref:Ribosomal L1 domain-containing protein 1 n=1 Tax=Rhynocoris fuscipes TaxID=488301 RepID=A0AAW1DFI1_9HEMI